MKARDLMTENPACVTPDDTAQRAAQLMADNDCGCVPVVDGRDKGRVVGVITDRDIALRATARGKGPQSVVRELMTPEPECCGRDTDLLEIERVMGDRQVRRVIVVDDDRCCVGIVAQADLARAAERGVEVTDREIAQVVERISEAGPASRTRSTAGGAFEQGL